MVPTQPTVGARQKGVSDRGVREAKPRVLPAGDCAHQRLERVPAEEAGGDQIKEEGDEGKQQEQGEF